MNDTELLHVLPARSAAIADSLGHVNATLRERDEILRTLNLNVAAGVELRDGLWLHFGRRDDDVWGLMIEDESKESFEEPDVVLSFVPVLEADREARLLAAQDGAWTRLLERMAEMADRLLAIGADA